MKRTIILFLAAFVVSSYAIGQDKQQGETPLNIIILIGDGMGLSQLTVPYYYEDREPVFNQFKHVGLVRTSSAREKITNSAAGSTAMFTGTKTYNDAIGVDVDTVKKSNLVEILSKQNYLSGVVATNAITDATPAGFYAHVPDRYMEQEIATQLLASDIDIFAGGGLKHFIDTTGRDLFQESNTEVNFSRLKKIKKPEPGKKYGFLLSQNYMPPVLNGRGDFLKKATEISLDFLSSQGQGFILMVEGSQIDYAGHGNNARYLISEMNDFEDACRAAYEFALEDGNTLVIVTADHETGGFTLSASGTNDYAADYNTINPTFATTNHSASMVPLLAFGPGAETFGGIYENSDIFHKIMALIRAE